MFLALFGAYVGQPDGHIGWVTLMPFASINPTNPRTNLWNFGENCSAFGGGWKTQFFWVGHFEFFFSKKKFFFCFFLIQISQDLWCTKDFSKFLISSKKLGGYKVMRHTVYLATVILKALGNGKKNLSRLELKANYLWEWITLSGNLFLTLN